jgi:uncharacterized membrane protein YqgA involved in biofilm formation
MPFIGTIINLSCIVLFSVLGSLVRHGIPQRCKKAILSSVAICVFFFGISNAVSPPDPNLNLPDAIFGVDITRFVILILSMAIGTLIGELIDIDELVTRLGICLEKRFKRLFRKKCDEDVCDFEEQGGNFAKGFVSCTIMTCVGAMSVNGAILDATGEPGMLIAKAVIDAISCFVMATSLGIGCAFSAIPVLVYQGSITLITLFFSDIIPAESIYYLSLTGYLIIILIATNFLGATKIRTANMIPAVFMPLIITPIISLF